MIETAVVNWTTSILESFGIVWGLFVILVMAIIYVLVKYIPIAFNSHFKAITEMQDAHNKNTIVIQDKFSENLNSISWQFIGSLNKLWDEHEKQMDKLNDIHNDIKIYHK